MARLIVSPAEQFRRLLVDARDRHQWKMNDFSKHLHPDDFHTARRGVEEYAKLLEAFDRLLGA